MNTDCCCNLRIDCGRVLLSKCHYIRLSPKCLQNLTENTLWRKPLRLTDIDLTEDSLPQGNNFTTRSYPELNLSSLTLCNPPPPSATCLMSLFLSSRRVPYRSLPSWYIPLFILIPARCSRQDSIHLCHIRHWLHNLVHSHEISCLFVPDIFRKTLLSNTLSLCSSRSVNFISHTYKATDNYKFTF